MFKLAIADEVEVPINFTTTSGGRPATFRFKLVCQRLTVADFTERLKVDPERKVADVVAELVIGWRDQRLVLDESGEPAEFSSEALAVMFSVPGLGDLAFSAYQREAGVRAKN